MGEDIRFRPNRRLQRPDEFRAVFAGRRALRGRLFDLHYLPNGGVSARLGFVIVKKLARRAVWRNAMKRAGREAFRLACPGLPAMDLLIRLARPVEDARVSARQAWRTEIDDLLVRLPR